MTDDQPAAVSPPEADAPTPPKDSFEARFKETQRAFHAQARAFAEYRATHPDVESEPGEGEDDEVDDGEPAPSRFRTAPPARPRIPEPAHDSEAAELGRSIASAVHGPDALAAYDKAMAMLEQATTTADRVTAFATFAELQDRASAAASSAPQRTSPAERRPTREALLEPVVQTNRPDGPLHPDFEPDPKRFEGGKNGGVGGWLREKFAAGRDAR